MHTKKEFYSLLSFSNFRVNQRNSFFGFMANVPPLIRRLIVIVLILGARHFAQPAYAQDYRYVRVAVMQDIENLRLKISGPYEIIDLRDNTVICRGSGLNTTVLPYRSGIMLGNIKPKTAKLLIRPKDQDSISVNNRTFGGDIEFIKTDNSRFLVVNIINLEDYVKGISIREISHYWPPETLKAEVIAFRTFALFKMDESAGRDYDLTSDIYSQVYGGKAAERYRINSAVDETKGLVLKYRGKVIPAFYHATCAGHTEDASVLWNINLPPLKGVACNFCKDSPHFNWHYVASTGEIKEKLAEHGYKVKDLKDLVVLGSDASGRITDLKIVSSGKDTLVSAKDFRDIIGPNVIKSANFKVDVVGSDIVFEGFGWGHGVGLCQWGAYFMGKEGFTYEQILKHYYPGAEISRLST